MSSRPPTNLLVPFRRDRARDFAAGSRRELVRSKVLQVLLTEGDTPQSSGELPRRTAFGSGVHLARRQRNDDALAELTRVRVRDALRRWMPDAQPLDVEAFAEANMLRVHVHVGEDAIEVSVPRER